MGRCIALPFPQLSELAQVSGVVKSISLNQRNLTGTQKGAIAAYPGCPSKSLGYLDLENRLLLVTVAVINFT